MKLKDLITGIFSADQTKLIQGIEGKLLSRNRSGTISLLIGFFAAIVQLFLEIVGKDLFSWSYVRNFFNFLLDIISFHWKHAFTYKPVLGIAGFYVLIIGFVVYFILKRTRFLMKESEEPFRYTFWIKPFTAIEGTPGPRFDLKGNDRFNLLHHDLMERLNARIQRLSLLDLETIKPEDGKTNETLYEESATAQTRLVAHIHIDGDYAIREQKDKKWVIHVMPRIRIGAAGKPSTLGYSVYYPLEKDRELTADRYNQLVERVYSSVATEVYEQIEADIEEKLKLFPTPYLRTVALYNEARDFARSNTIDAYDRAMRLYKAALRFFDVAKIKGLTKEFLRYRWTWRWKLNSTYTIAKIQTGYARCLIYRKVVSTLTGRYNNSLFEILPMMNECLDRLERIQSWLEKSRKKGNASLLISNATFPKDSWVRYKLRKLIPTEELIEKQRNILSEAHLVSALGHFYLDAVAKARFHLERAKAIDPQLGQRKALYFLTAALIEPDLEESILLLRKATELSPDFQIAQYLLASKSEMRLRMRYDLSPARALSVIKEYDRVLLINPGNIAALAAQGYLWWLLGDLESARLKFEEGKELKSIVSETFIGELDYGLARIAAEQGRFNDSYELYSTAISADPRVGAYSYSVGSFDLNFKEGANLTPVSPFSLSTGSRINTPYYEYVVPEIVERYSTFCKQVQYYGNQKMKKASELTNADVKDSSGFIIKLRDADGKQNDTTVAETDKNNKENEAQQTNTAAISGDLLSKFIRQQLPEDCKKFIQEYDGADTISLEIKKAIVNQLNKLLDRKDLYDPVRFRQTLLTEEAERLIKQNPQGKQLNKLNRLLLELAYPNELEIQEEVSDRIAQAVCSFAVNDHGNACMNAYSRLGESKQLQEAKKSFNEALELNPENFIANYNLYRVWKWENNDAEALNCIRQVRNQFPSWQDATIIFLQDDIKVLNTTIKKQAAELEVEKFLEEIPQQSESKSGAATTSSKSATPPKQNPNTIDLSKTLADLKTKWKLQKNRAIEEVTSGTKLASHFEFHENMGNEYLSAEKNVSDSRIEELISNTKITWSERFDESDVKALKAFAVIQSFDNQNEEDLKQSAKICSLILDKFYPDNFETTLLLNQVLQNLEALKEPGQASTPQSITDSTSKGIFTNEVKSTVEYWINMDPIHDAALKWIRLKQYFEFNESVSILARVIKRNLTSKLGKGDRIYNMRGNIYAESGDEYNENALNDYVMAIQKNPEVLEYYVNLGRMYNKLGQNKNGEEVLRKGLKIIPDIAEEWNLIGVIYFELKKYDKAQHYFAKAVELNPNLAVYHSNLGLAFQYREDRDMAASEYQEALKLDPEYGGDWNYLGNIYFQKEEFRKALAYYQKAIQKSPTVGVFHSNLGLAYDKLKNVDEAEKAFRKAIELDPNAAASWNDLGNLYFDKKEYQKALEYYQEANAKDPKTAVYHSNIGLANQQLKNFEVAIKAFKEAQELDPQKSEYWNYLGNVYAHLSDDQNAAAQYRKAIEIKSDIAVYHSNLALTYSNLNELDKAENEFKEALKLNPESATDHNQLGNLYLKKEEYQNALMEYQQAIEKDPTLAVYHSNLGIAYTDLKDSANAEAAFKYALELNPESADDWNFLGANYQGKGEYEKALEQYQKAVKLDSKNALYYSNTGLTYHQLGKYEEAVNAYNEALKLDPENSFFWNGLGNVSIAKKEYEQAKAYYQKAIEKNWKLPVYHSNLGLAYLNLKEDDKAETAFNEALAIDPDRSGDWNYLGNLYLRKDQFNKALEYYRMAVEKNPKIAVYHSNIGLACQRLGEFDEAEKAFHEALSLDPDSAPDWNDLGNVYVVKGEYEKALALFQKASEKNPDAAVYYSNIGLAQIRLGKIEEAENAYKEALRLNPDSDADMNDLGKVYIKSETYDKAVEQFLKAIEKNPDFGVYYSNLGLAYNQLNELSKAEEAFKEALKRDPNSAVDWNYLGNLYIGRGEYEKAIEQYQKALTLAPNVAVYHTNLGLALEQLGRFDETEIAFKEALSFDSRNAIPWVDLANLYYAMAEDADASDNNDHIETNQTVSTDTDLGTVVQESFKDTQPLEAFTEAVKNPPDFKQQPRRTANMIYELAARHFLGAIKLDQQNNPVYADNLIRSCEKMNDKTGALQILNEAALVPSYENRFAESISRLKESVVT